MRIAERQRQEELERRIQLVAQERRRQWDAQLKQWRILQEKSLKQRIDFWCPLCWETVPTVATFHDLVRVHHLLRDDREDLV